MAADDKDSPAAAAVNVDLVQELVWNGLTKEDAVAALMATGNNIVAAVEFQLMAAEGAAKVRARCKPKVWMRHAMGQSSKHIKSTVAKSLKPDTPRNPSHNPTLENNSRSPRVDLPLSHP